ncbi:MAG: hypothetical protein NBV67_15780 [Tagaea sp.]|nr:hypothetical protein [Tagaea sp.]
MSQPAKTKPPLKTVPHPSARDVRKLKALVLRAKAGLRRDGCVTFAQHQALIAVNALPAKVVR